MKSINLVISLILLTFLASTAVAKPITKLGERFSSCKNLEKDDFLITFQNPLKKEAKTLLEKDQLRTAIVKSPKCFRVGTEIQLNVEKEDIPFWGRGLIESMEQLSKDQILKSNKTGYTKSALRSFVKNSPAKKYEIIQFKVTEKIEEAVVTEKYKRLNSCFPAYGDWESLRLKDPATVKNIQSGKTKAIMWNGTFNCYKIGVYTEIVLQTEEPSPDDLGYIVPAELHLVHFTSLTQEHAKLLGQPLSKLKKSMEEKIEVDGGYLTMVVFDFEKVHPKDLEEEPAS